jgi:two-component system chemotaxis response regulator CheY
MSLQAANRKPKQSEGKRLLIVCSDDGTREVLRGACESEGYIAVAVRTGEEALAALVESQSPALVLLDWNMEGMTGDEFLQLIRRDPQIRSTPVVIISSDAHPTRLIAESAALICPMNLDAIIEGVETLLSYMS